MMSVCKAILARSLYHAAFDVVITSIVSVISVIKTLVVRRVSENDCVTYKSQIQGVTTQEAYNNVIKELLSKLDVSNINMAELLQKYSSFVEKLGPYLTYALSAALATMTARGGVAAYRSIRGAQQPPAPGNPAAPASQVAVEEAAPAGAESLGNVLVEPLTSLVTSVYNASLGHMLGYISRRGPSAGSSVQPPAQPPVQPPAQPLVQSSVQPSAEASAVPRSEINSEERPLIDLLSEIPPLNPAAPTMLDRDGFLSINRMPHWDGKPLAQLLPYRRRSLLR